MAEIEKHIASESVKDEALNNEEYERLIQDEIKRVDDMSYDPDPNMEADFLFPEIGGEKKIPVKPLDVIRVNVAREEWQAACDAWKDLHEKIRLFTRAAMAEMKAPSESRNHAAWMMFFDLYCQQISRESEAAENALYSLVFSVETGARLATFAKLDEG